MKKLNLLKIPLQIFVVFLFLSSGGCNKEPIKTLDKSDATQLKTLASAPVYGKYEPKETWRNIKIKSKVSKTSKPLDEAKLAAFLIERKKKIKKNIKLNKTSAATFSVTDYGSTYLGYAETQATGTIDYYLAETYSGTWTHLGETDLGFINFWIDKPYVYEEFIIWSPQEGSSNALNLGDPYVGVSFVNGMLHFENETALNNILTRLDDGYEDHQADFFDTRESMSEVDINNLADQVGFDEFLPLRTFEAYWGFSSLRAMAESEINAYNLNSDLPEPMLDVDDEIEQTVLNTNSTLYIDQGEQYMSIELPGQIHTTERCSVYPGPACFEQDYDRGTDTIGDFQVRKIVRTKKKLNSNTAFMLRAKAKAKAIFFKQTGPKSRKRYATKMDARVNGNAYTADWTYTNVTCGTLIEAFDIPTSTKTRYRRKARKDWPSVYITFKYCQVTGTWVIPNHSFGTRTLSLH